MVPHIGTVCKYVLTTRFASLNGVYSTLSLQTYETFLQAGLSLTKTLYTPAGLSDADRVADDASYRGTLIIEVASVTDPDTIYYFPEGVLAMTPDPTVSRYQQIYLAIYIGAFKNTAQYSFIKSQVEDMVQSVTGNTDTAKWLANPNEDLYLTESEYETLDAARQANIKAVTPYITTIQNQLTIINTLQAQNAALREKLISSSGTA